jgi:hypothetical protein
VRKQEILSSSGGIHPVWLIHNPEIPKIAVRQLLKYNLQIKRSSSSVGCKIRPYRLIYFLWRLKITFSQEENSSPPKKRRPNQNQPPFSLMINYYLTAFTIAARIFSYRYLIPAGTQFIGDIVDVNIPDIAKIIIERFIDICSHAVRFQLFQAFNRLIQSHAQTGPASAGALKIKQKIFVFRRLRLEDFFQFGAGGVGYYQHNQRPFHIISVFRDNLFIIFYEYTIKPDKFNRFLVRFVP